MGISIKQISSGEYMKKQTWSDHQVELLGAVNKNVK